MSQVSTLPLTAERATDGELTGGKAANLARLAGAGLPVPDGFCVTTAAYHDAVDGTAVPDLVDRLDGLEPGEPDAADLGERLRSAIREAPVSERVRAAVTEQLSAFPADAAFAVRSSATAEDLPGASFAGQHETVLDVSGPEAVVAAVRACQASLFTDRAIAYRARNGIDHGEVSMAVVVQEMVDADASGIAFTADPVTGTRTVTTIDAGYGLGEAQVGGRVTADTVRVDERSGEILDYRVGEPEQAVRPTGGGGTERVPVSEADSTGRVLTDDQVLTLAAYGDRIESLFDEPQDVEWALADGRFHVLQARPVTALFPVPDGAPTDELRVYYSFGHRQGMPDAMPPFVLDYWRRLTDEVTAQFGIPGRFGAEAGGRLYIDITPYLARPRLRDLLFDRFEAIDEPMVADLRDLLDERADELPPVETDAVSRIRTAGSLCSRLAPRVAEMVVGLVSGLVDPDPLSAPVRTRRFYGARCDEAVGRIRAGADHDTRIRRAMNETAASLEWVFEEFYPFYAAMVARPLLERLCPDGRDDIEALVRGIDDDPVTAMNLALGDVAVVARENPAVADALRAGEEYETVRRREGGEAFAAALDAFLDEYGFRAAGEIDFSRPRYRDDPAPLLRTVRGLLAADTDESPRDRSRRLRARATAARERLRSAADTGIAGPVRRRLVDHLAAVYRGYFGVRELPKFGISPLFAETREQVLGAGETLTETGRLDDPEDVWLLRLDELATLLDDPEASVDLSDRRREFERHQRLRPPRFVTSDGEVPRARVERASDPSAALAGTGASAGVVEGVARVVTTPATADLEAGEILVCPYVDPGWTPLFLNAAGLVTEVGGRLTHGSLVAREHGIPAVVAVDDATARIRSGQRVRVDGDRGIVDRLE
ncbi:pyruvate, phosphate dikinase [Halosimplex litoreum]|uniref:Pyruvate, phosphate dikinase n=1 Tax=Halosimplex litoreum TaxID=1198301 RepID=A0A7T3FXL9_9EURY|nr:PEP/pyruvate-binding domain-containing protein [Halosimplex litoreum]QPV62560.1 pyruvate, phosphate dikinase [Halosimplex litoreum]